MNYAKDFDRLPILEQEALALLVSSSVEKVVEFLSAKGEIEGAKKKSLQNVLLYIAKVINPRVKSQARGQNNSSLALK